MQFAPFMRSVLAEAGRAGNVSPLMPDDHDRARDRMPVLHVSRRIAITAFCAVLATACGSDTLEPIQGITTVDAGADAGGGNADAGGGNADTGTADTSEREFDDAAIVLNKPTAPPTCALANDALMLPAEVTADASGGLLIEPSGYLQPLGELEKVAVFARNKDGGIDTQATGTPAVTAVDGVDIVSVTPFLAGRAVVQVRVQKAGNTTLKVVSSAPARSGTAVLRGYLSKLPIWRLQADDSEWKGLLATATKNVWIPVTLFAQGVKHSGKVRLHGGSSREYPKKSLRFNLSGAGLDDGTTKVILRAEWRDKSMLRAWLAMALLRELTPLPVSDARWIHLRRIDGEFLGLMMWIERIDFHFLQKRGLNANGDLFEADPPFLLAVPGGTLTVRDDASEYAKVYQQHAGVDGFGPLQELIEQTLQRDDETLAATLDSDVRVDRLLVYLAAMAMIQNQDHIKKNYYLYRDKTAADPRWEMLAWDLDLTFGHLWTPEHEILGEDIFTDGDPLVGRNKGSAYYNQLIDRVLRTPKWRARFDALVGEFLERVDADFVRARVRAALCEIAPDLVADRRKRAAPAELQQRVDELADFVTARSKWLATWLAER